MSDLIKQRLAENKETPYMAQHEIVFELIALEEKVDALGGENLLSLIKDMCDKIDTLEVKVADLEKGIVAMLHTDKKQDEAPVEDQTAGSQLGAESQKVD